MEQRKIIQVQDVSLKIQDASILNHISMEMEVGKIYGLVGRNGSGKTMLMKCICGFVKPTRGVILVNNRKVGVDMDFPENMGILIETPGFIPYYSGYRNLKLLADLRHPLKKEELNHYLELVGLDPTLSRHVGKYSLGMRQRLGLAQALMEEPEILMLDEPMNGLDKDGVADMRKLFLELKEAGKTMVIASHNADDIALLCDHVWELEKGNMEQLR